MAMMSSLPALNDAEDFNETDGISYIKLVLQMLGLKSNIENDEMLNNLLFRLCNTYFDYQFFLDKVCNTLVENGFCPLAHEISTFLIKSSRFQNESFDNLLNVLINFSDFSFSFAKSVLSSGILVLLTDFCIAHQDSDFLQILKQNQLICSAITVIHNVVRNPQLILESNTTEFKQALFKFISYNNADKLGILSILIMSHIIQESETNLLDKGVNIIGILLNTIQSVNPVDHRCSGFTVKELLYGLQCLSANENVKIKIHSEKGLPLLFDIINGDYSDDEKELALTILWSLCFNTVIKVILKNDFKLEEVISKFSDTKNAEIKKNCDGILWELNDNTSKARPLLFSDSSNNKFDVFISYSREYKEIISKIIDTIKESNFKVWLDDEQMYGSTIEAMASGIENSRVIMIAMSKAYTDSPNCRSEAEYAFKLHKPIVPVVLQLKFKPMSWLGFIVGTKMYYEFSERRDPHATLTGIVNSIRFITDKKSEAEEIIEPRKVSECESAINAVVKKWKKADVSKWLLESQLGNLRKNFKELDGSLLEVLINLKDKSPEYFNHTLKQEFGMKFVDVLKFHKALNMLTVA